MRARQVVSLIVLACVAAAAQPPVAGATGEDAARADRLAQAILAAERLAAPAATPNGRADLALAKLHWERAARLLLGEVGDFEITVETELAAGEQAMAWLATATQPFAGVTGDNLTLAYEAENDRSTQPYFLYVPTGYRDGTPTPLVVYLHGWLPGTTKLSPWVLGPSVYPLLDEYGALFVQPHGRGNTDFQGVGEVDVLRTIEEVSRLYSVDPDRVYLAGNSMGGYGAYCIGLHHPDRFAALAPACAQADYYLWYGLDRATVPAFKRAMYEMSNPVDLLANARNLPILIQHGGSDPLVNAEFARIADRELTRLGYEHDLNLVEGGRHEIYFAESYFRRLLDYCQARTRVRLPRHVTWRTYTLDTPGAYWLRVEAIAGWGEAAEVDASVEGGLLRLSVRNAARVGLLASALGELGVTRLEVDGGELPVPPTGEDGWVPLDLAVASPGPLTKKQGLCGPIRAVFERPFLCVYGTAGGAGEDDPLLEGFTADWWRYCEGLPLLTEPREGRWSSRWAIADTAVTPEIEEQYNLIVFGTPRENGYLAGIAGALPVRFLGDGYAIGTSEQHGDDLGLWLCYPNPRAPERMVLSVSGTPWGGGFSLVTRFSHRYDLLPDYILFDSTIDADNGNHWRVAGFFGQDWQLGNVEEEPPGASAPMGP